MWQVTDTIEIASQPEALVEVMLDSFRPNPGFTYVGRTVIIRTPHGTEYSTSIVDTKSHPGTWSFTFPVMAAMVPPGSFLRFLHNGVDVQ